MREFDDIYGTYIVLKDALRITGRVFDRDIPVVQRKTIFEAMPYDEFSKSHDLALSELDNLVVLSLFAAFERSLRERMLGKMDILKSIKPDVLGTGIHRLTVEEIEKWRIKDIFTLFDFMIDKKNINRLEEILKYRNWIAHGKNQNKLPPAKIDPQMAYDAILFFLGSMEKIDA